MYTARNYTRYVNACDGVTAPMCLNQGNRFIHSGIKYGCLIDRCLRACSTAVRTEAAPLPRLPCLRLPGSYVPLLPLLSPFSSFLSSLPLTMILNSVGELATRCLNRELALRLVRVLTWMASSEKICLELTDSDMHPPDFVLHAFITRGPCSILQLSSFSHRCPILTVH